MAKEPAETKRWIQRDFCGPLPIWGHSREKPTSGNSQMNQPSLFSHGWEESSPGDALVLSSPYVLLTGTTKIASIFCQTETRASCFPAFLIWHAARSRLNVQHTGVLHSSAIFNKALSTVSCSVMNQHIFASSLSEEGLERQNLGVFFTLYSELWRWE